MIDLLEAAQQAGLLGLTETLDHLLAQAIAAASSGPAQLVPHGRDPRTAPLRLPAGGVLGPAGRDAGSDPPLRQARRLASEQKPASAETSFGRATVMARAASISGSAAA